MDFHRLNRVHSPSAREALVRLRRPKEAKAKKGHRSGTRRIDFRENAAETTTERVDGPNASQSGTHGNQSPHARDVLAEIAWHKSKLESLEVEAAAGGGATSQPTSSQPDQDRPGGDLLSTPGQQGKTTRRKFDPSFWDFLLADFEWDSVVIGSFPSADKQKLDNLKRIPFALEKLQIFGFFVCFDTLLNMFTVVPIRIVLASCKILAAVLAFPASVMLRRSVVYVGRRHVYDLFLGILLGSALYVLWQYFKMDILYHYLRSQSGIKLYVLFGMLDIFDRLCTSLGQDVIEALHCTTLNEPHNLMRLTSNCVAALVYVVLHSILKFVQLVTLNVAINSRSNAVFTLVISSNFAEMKSLVFKRFDESNVFQISCADIVERFMLCVFLILVFVQNWAQRELSVSEAFYDEAFRQQVGVAFQLWFCEVLVDWIKHAFISKFNRIKSESYGTYAVIISDDILSHRRRRRSGGVPHMDSSHAVTQRLGLAALPLACIVVRICVGQIGDIATLYNPLGLAVLFMAFLCLCASKVLSGMLLMSYCLVVSRGAYALKGGATYDALAKINRYTLHKNRIP